MTCTAALHYSYAGPTSWWLGLDGTSFVASRYGLREVVGSRKAAIACDSLARIPSLLSIWLATSLGRVTAAA